MKDFTQGTYELLLEAFQKAGYSFCTYSNGVAENRERVIIIRHDIDKKPGNALKTATLEMALGIKGTYYFRAVRKEAEVKYLKAIAEMGHEIGYHYEDFALCRGDYEKAICSFKENLSFFREYYPVTTICMHGSPLSQYDNRLLWSRYDYRSMGINYEPYFDADMTSFLYLSDTGRRWDGAASIRDRAGLNSKEPAIMPWDMWVVMPLKESMIRVEDTSAALHDQYRFRTTKDIIDAVDAGAIPQKVLLTIHPQRWEDNTVMWLKEAVLQNVKNLIKKLLNH